jgi:Fur family transcriptional regulator, peroxide stress response regulator
MRSPEELIALFRANSLKATPQRYAVFEALYQDGSHPTAEGVWDRVRQQMPSVSLRTVYQALGDLVSLGELGAVSVNNGAVRFDPNVSPHAHFVCRVCERIFDVIASHPHLISTHPDLAGVASASEDLVVEATEIIFRGSCASCRRDSSYPTLTPST